jgi:uncharacterized membrane protein
MAVGYACGHFYRMPADRRRRALVGIGGATTLAFVVLRGLSGYGDPNPWASQERGAVFTLISFLNTTKYPPSLLFLLMTLGPAILALPVLESARGRAARFFITFGRVPLFFYLIHFPLLHFLGQVWLSARYGSWIHWSRGFASWPDAYQAHLGEVYVAWILVTLALFFACRWFGSVKRRHTSWWLRYL